MPRLLPTALVRREREVVVADRSLKQSGTMLTKYTLAFMAALVLAAASTAFAQSNRQTGYPRRAEPRSVPVLSNPRNAGQAAQDCNTTYQGFRMCDWLRPSPWN